MEEEKDVEPGTRGKSTALARRIQRVKEQDEYKNEIKIDEFHREKFMVLANYWKEKLDAFMTKVMFYWYYHILERAIYIIVRGSNEKWIKVQERIEIDDFS